MKSRLALLLAALLLGALVSTTAPRLAAQASAVDSMTATNSTASVNTSFIANKPYLYQTVPTRSTGTYRRVWSATGDINGTTSESGTFPSDTMFWSYAFYYWETGKWYAVFTGDDGYFYIQRYVENYNSNTGAVTWSLVYYKGPATVAPVLSDFTVSATRLWQGQSLHTTASATDADNDVWWLNVYFYLNTTTAFELNDYGWNYDRPSLSITDSRILSVPGKWRVTLLRSL